MEDLTLGLVEARESKVEVASVLVVQTCEWKVAVHHVEQLREWRILHSVSSPEISPYDHRDLELLRVLDMRREASVSNCKLKTGRICVSTTLNRLVYSE